MGRIALIILFFTFGASSLVLSQNNDFNLNTKKNASTLLLKAYPNPAYDALLIEHDYMSDTPYQIYSIEGRVVQQGLLQEQFSIINIKSLPEGMYIFFVEGKTTRIVKVNPQ